MPRPFMFRLDDRQLRKSVCELYTLYGAGAWAGLHVWPDFGTGACDDPVATLSCINTPHRCTHRI